MNSLIKDIDSLITEYTVVTDEDDDSMYALKEALLSLSLPDLKFLIIYSEFDKNIGLCARYFNTSIYFAKKRLNKILSQIKKVNDN